MRHIITSLVVAFLGLENSAYADVAINPVLSNYWVVTVSSSITKDDAKKFDALKQAWDKSAVTMNPKKVAVQVNLNSQGGDLYASMKIGRVMRGIHALAQMKSGEVCYSSCVFLLAGAMYRAVDGEVGIHRPYLPAAESTDAAKEKVKYQALQGDIEKYLSEMNIDTRLYKDMLLVPPQNMKQLSRKELEGYGLAQNDVYADEAQAMNRARELRISRSELASRELTAEKLCRYKNEGDEKRAATEYLDCKIRVAQTGK
jgi:hypothetical protein